MTEDQPKDSLKPEYFDDVYNAQDDPWNFETSEYEAANMRRRSLHCLIQITIQRSKSAVQSAF